MKIALFLATLAICTTANSTNAAVTVFSDTFSATAIGAQPANWWKASSDSGFAVTIQDDAAAGGSKAMDINYTSTNSKWMAVNFPATTLADGDSIALSLSFRALTDPVPVSDAKFRFSLGNSNGTQPTANNQAVFGDDEGYVGLFDLGADPLTTSTGSIRVSNGTPGTLSTGGRSVTDANTQLTDNNFHTESLILLRIGNTLQVTGVLNGVTLTFTDAAPVNDFTFDQITLGLASNSPTFRYRIDDVSITYTPIPEPTATTTLLATAALLLKRRR